MIHYTYVLNYVYFICKLYLLSLSLLILNCAGINLLAFQYNRDSMRCYCIRKELKIIGSFENNYRLKGKKRYR